MPSLLSTPGPWSVIGQQSSGSPLIGQHSARSPLLTHLSRIDRLMVKLTTSSMFASLGEESKTSKRCQIFKLAIFVFSKGGNFQNHSTLNSITCREQFCRNVDKVCHTRIVDATGSVRHIEVLQGPGVLRNVVLLHHILVCVIKAPDECGLSSK